MLRQSAKGAVPSVLPAVRLAPVPWGDAGRVVDSGEIAGQNSIRPALLAFLVGVTRVLVDTTVAVADVLPRSSGRSLITAVETFGREEILCAASIEPRAVVVRPAVAGARSLCTLGRLPTGTVQTVRSPWAAAAARPALLRWFRIPVADL